ncbi:methyltransferase [Spiroplasma clarkii]|uniref:Methyltransferase n=2 Tax=Spiroplasma clarkii TaxID=2139 RepID=A0A1Y0L0E0_9MOLU|nr:methyltransferase [Spiroplasma clarkii]ATX70889.1 methyltransferase [Spiroplasma clarkii]
MLYDETKPSGTSVDGDLEFYKNILLPIEGKVLEAGVGNGRLLVPFLKYKIDLVGVDKSSEMLKLCKNNLQINNLSCELICADLKNYLVKNYFEMIIMPNASFCLIENRIDAKIILKNFYESLIHNGQLVLDLIFPVEFVAGASHEYIHNVKGIKLLVKNYSQTINWIEQYTINKIQYFINEEIQEEQNVKLSWYGVEEFKSILNEIGFKEIEVVLNYNNKKLINLKTVTFICKK